VTESEGQKPEYRMGHTATYDPIVRCIYVFGGSKNTRWFHDVHMLDIEEWKWQLLKVELIALLYVSKSEILGPIDYVSDIENVVSFERAMFEDYGCKYRIKIFLLFILLSLLWNTHLEHHEQSTCQI